MNKRKASSVDEPEGVDGRSKSTAGGLAGSASAPAKQSIQPYRKWNWLWEDLHSAPMRKENDHSGDSFDVSKNDMSARAFQMLVKKGKASFNGENKEVKLRLKTHYVPKPPAKDSKWVCNICETGKQKNLCVAFLKSRKKNQDYFCEQVCAHPEGICSDCMKKMNSCPYCRKNFSDFAVFEKKTEKEMKLVRFSSLSFNQSSDDAYRLATSHLNLSRSADELAQLNSEQRSNHMNALRYAGLLSTERGTRRPLSPKIFQAKIIAMNKIRRVKNFVHQHLLSSHGRNDELYKNLCISAELYQDCIDIDELIYFMRKQQREFDSSNFYKWEEAFPSLHNMIHAVGKFVDEIVFLPIAEPVTIDLTS